MLNPLGLTKYGKSVRSCWRFFIYVEEIRKERTGENNQSDKTDAQNVVNNQQKSDLKAYKNLYEDFILPLSWKIDQERIIHL